MTSAATSSGTVVWERLWRQPASAEHDSAQLRREERGPRWALVRQALVSTFGSLAGLRSIELGSGRGDLSALLAAGGAEVTLLDDSDAALAQARHRFERLQRPARFVKADLLGDWRAWAGRFDVAGSLGVIEHFKGRQRAEAIAAHRQVLRSGGLAIISVPYAWGVPYRLWKLFLEVRGRWPYGLEIPYARSELRRLARAAGFGRIEVHATGFWQGLGDHWIRSLTGWSPDWYARRSRWDAFFGGTLTLLAWTGEGKRAGGFMNRGERVPPL